ncbi:MAG: hypothetical protein IT495_09250 [Gammaproteobacteria bacterium]|nr:hypothetical protein [Gammaproteobacteria bacterium]
MLPAQITLFLVLLSCAGTGTAAGTDRHFGAFRLPDASLYRGWFEDGHFEGLGSLLWHDGSRYDGEFHAGLMHGHGALRDRDGLQYEGEFRAGVMHGQGSYYYANGDHYEGGFVDGVFEGSGTLHYRDEDGRAATLTGRWEDGDYVPADTAAAMPADALAGLDGERLLFSQRERLDAAIDAVAPSRAGLIDLYFLGFAGDGDSDVFMKEVLYAERTFSERYATAGRSLLLVNNRATIDTRPLATATNLEYALTRLATRMDPVKDILFLFMSSHGSEQHALEVQLGEVPIHDLGAARLAHLLEASGIRYKVVVLSACYSGGFIEPLASADTLVITAARTDRVSFGCGDDDDLTYFGRAFFERALPGSASFEDAFDRARRFVREREDADGLEHSLPQIATGAGIRAHLIQWRHELSAAR